MEKRDGGAECSVDRLAAGRGHDDLPTRAHQPRARHGQAVREEDTERGQGLPQTRGPDHKTGDHSVSRGDQYPVLLGGVRMESLVDTCNCRKASAGIFRLAFCVFGFLDFNFPLLTCFCNPQSLSGLRRLRESNNDIFVSAKSPTLR